MKDNILITGSRGFIGSRIEGGKPFIGRIQNYHSVNTQTTDDVVGIVHFAAKSNDRMCHDNLRKSIESNLIGLQNVLEVAFKKQKWVLFISTFQVTQKTFYGLSKLMGEEMCRLFKERGLKVSILRLPIVYGEGDNPDKVVTKFINQIRQGIDPIIEVDAMFYFSYVIDVVNMIEREVNVIQHYNCGEFHTLYDLKAGIKECLKNERDKNDR